MDTKKKEAALNAAEDLEAMEAAAETAAEVTTEDDTEDAEISLVLKFRKPYVFEEKTYTEVDLSGLDDLSTGALDAVGRILLKKRPGLNPSTLEMTMEYAELLANRVTHLPVEFFKGLPPKEGIKLKSTVVGFLFGGDGED